MENETFNPQVQTPSVEAPTPIAQPAPAVQSETPKPRRKAVAILSVIALLMTAAAGYAYWKQPELFTKETVMALIKGEPLPTGSAIATKTYTGSDWVEGDTLRAAAPKQPTVEEKKDEEEAAAEEVAEEQKPTEPAVEKPATPEVPGDEAVVEEGKAPEGESEAKVEGQAPAEEKVAPETPSDEKIED